MDRLLSLYFIGILRDKDSAYHINFDNLHQQPDYLSLVPRVVKLSSPRNGDWRAQYDELGALFPFVVCSEQTGG
jgi:hypothetical protein